MPRRMAEPHRGQMIQLEYFLEIYFCLLFVCRIWRTDLKKSVSIKFDVRVPALRAEKNWTHTNTIEKVKTGKKNRKTKFQNEI